jgi:hypothetical protein
VADWDDVRAAAEGMPSAMQHVTRGDRAWKVGERGKLFAWERPLRAHDIEQHGPEDGPILGVRVADEGEKLALIESDEDVFFTIPHFDGYNAVLVRLDRISPERLAEVIVDSWIAVAPPRAVAAYLSERG